MKPVLPILACLLGGCAVTQSHTRSILRAACPETVAVSVGVGVTSGLLAARDVLSGSLVVTPLWRFKPTETHRLEPPVQQAIAP